MDLKSFDLLFDNIDFNIPLSNECDLSKEIKLSLIFFVFLSPTNSGDNTSLFNVIDLLLIDLSILSGDSCN